MRQNFVGLVCGVLCVVVFMLLGGVNFSLQLLPPVKKFYDSSSLVLHPPPQETDAVGCIGGSTTCKNNLNCPLFEICCSGCCVSTEFNSCSWDSCCPSGQYCCDKGCCDVGLSCCGSDCCIFETCCGGSTCCAGTCLPDNTCCTHQACGNSCCEGTCCDSSTEYCCSYEEQCCNYKGKSYCCPNGGKCCSTANSPGCCPHSTDVCCPYGGCCSEGQTCLDNNVCCDSSKACFLSNGYQQECCNATSSCSTTDGCCPNDRVICRGLCCPDGMYCEDSGNWPTCRYPITPSTSPLPITSSSSGNFFPQFDSNTWLYYLLGSLIMIFIIITILSMLLLYCYCHYCKKPVHTEEETTELIQN